MKYVNKEGEVFEGTVSEIVELRKTIQKPRDSLLTMKPVETKPHKFTAKKTRKIRTKPEIRKDIRKIAEKIKTRVDRKNVKSITKMIMEEGKRKSIPNPSLRKRIEQRLSYIGVNIRSEIRKAKKEGYYTTSSGDEYGNI